MGTRQFWGIIYFCLGSLFILGRGEVLNASDKKEVLTPEQIQKEFYLYEYEIKGIMSQLLKSRAYTDEFSRLEMSANNLKKEFPEKQRIVIDMANGPPQERRADLIKLWTDSLNMCQEKLETIDAMIEYMKEIAPPGDDSQDAPSKKPSSTTAPFPSDWMQWPPEKQKTFMSRRLEGEKGRAPDSMRIAKLDTSGIKNLKTVPAVFVAKPGEKRELKPKVEVPKLSFQQSIAAAANNTNKVQSAPTKDAYDPNPLTASAEIQKNPAVKQWCEEIQQETKKSCQGACVDGFVNGITNNIAPVASLLTHLNRTSGAQMRGWIETNQQVAAYLDSCIDSRCINTSVTCEFGGDAYMTALTMIGGAGIARELGQEALCRGLGTSTKLPAWLSSALCLGAGVAAGAKSAKNLKPKEAALDASSKLPNTNLTDESLAAVKIKAADNILEDRWHQLETPEIPGARKDPHPKTLKTEGGADFTYLDAGGQASVYISADKKRVIKVLHGSGNDGVVQNEDVKKFVKKLNNLSMNMEGVRLPKANAVLLPGIPELKTPQRLGIEMDYIEGKSLRNFFEDKTISPIIKQRLKNKAEDVLRSIDNQTQLGGRGAADWWKPDPAEFKPGDTVWSDADGIFKLKVDSQGRLLPTDNFILEFGPDGKLIYGADGLPIMALIDPLDLGALIAR
ncbi:MAG: hypothetical protein HY401_04890 [Elusimicrobia bacterium]|nr:hypothetical protein [Elusimicrobiota bacterium]